MSSASGTAPALKRLLCSDYYAINLLILLSYALWLRPCALGEQVAASPLSWITGSEVKAPFTAVEFQLGASLASGALIYAYRSSTCDAAVAYATMFAQLFVLAMAALVGGAAFATYAAAFGLVFMLSSHPRHEGPDKVHQMTAASFYSLCLHDGSAEARQAAGASSDDVTYVVFFYTDWSAKCSYGYALFADLANRYSTDRLRFARLDLGVWPSVGTVADVEVSAISGQLPSVITYERGHEERRVPSTRHKRKLIFSRLDLIHVLGLDVKLARSLQSASS